MNEEKEKIKKKACEREEDEMMWKIEISFDKKTN
jgi:hypothetical protein